MIAALAVVVFLMCAVTDWLYQGWLRASEHQRPGEAAMFSGAITAVSAIGLVLAIQVSMWLLVADVFGHAAGSYMGVRWRQMVD